MIYFGKTGNFRVYEDRIIVPVCVRAEQADDYITDLAKVHVCAVSRMINGEMKKDYEIFNVGTGRPLSVMELVTIFEKVNGVKVNHKITSRRPGDVCAVWCDPSLAEKELGWKACRPIEDTLRSAWEWQKHLESK